MARKIAIRTDAVVVREIGELLFGERWQRPLARAAGISQTRLSLIVNARSDAPVRMTPDMRRKIGDAITSWVIDMRRGRDEAVALGAELAASALDDDGE